MKPRTIILLAVGAFLLLGGFALSAESGAENPWAIACLLAGVFVAGAALVWRRK